MLQRARSSHFYFWLLLLVTFLITGLGLGVISWNYGQGWAQTVWHVCQSGLQNLGQHVPLTWQLIILIVVTAVALRGSWSIVQQVQQTRRFIRLFNPLQVIPPVRLQRMLKAHNLSVGEVVYLDLPATHAFCLGFWRPHIWLTSGLVNLLTDEELAAVLVHEACHCRGRDPLRLLISRAIRSAFFFLPLVSDLARHAELQQEVAADQSAIRQLGDDLPLLCALQKLLTQGKEVTPFPEVTLLSFKVSEARLRRLVYPSQSAGAPFQWREMLAKWTVNLSILIILSGISFWSTQPVVQHGEIGACTLDAVVQSDAITISTAF
jgi:hypothetical protein